VAGVKVIRLRHDSRERSDVNTDARDETRALNTGEVGVEPSVSRGRAETLFAAKPHVNRERTNVDSATASPFHGGETRTTQKAAKRHQAPYSSTCDNCAATPSGHATITVLRAAAAVAKRRAVFAGRHACPHR
jgi:hypothetical protein